MTETIYMPFYFEWAEILNHLPDAEYGKLVKAILNFAMGGEKAKKPRVSPAAEVAYKFITSAISRSEAKRCGATASGGEKPAPAKREKREKKVFKRIEKCAKEGHGKWEALPTTERNAERNEHGENTKRAEKDGKTSDFSTNSQMATPTRDEVCNFFRSRGFKSNSDEFFNFYESNGWRVGQNPMKNWHSSAENWEIKANRPTKRAENGENKQPNPHRGEEKSYDVHEAFRLALERSYGPNADDDE